MFGLGFSEILIMALIAFLAFGPKQFPIIAKEFIKLFNELKRSFTNIKTDFHDIEIELEKQIQKVKDPIEIELENKS